MKDEPVQDTIARFESQVEPEPMSGCWLWIGPCSQEGYGLFRIKGVRRRAHRIAWILYCGEITSDMSVCHRCDNRCCVNLDHLFLGTFADNMDDKVRKGRNTRGAAISTAKLNPEKVLAIRADCRSATLIASEYGVSDDTVHRIWQGTTWKHILNGGMTR